MISRSYQLTALAWTGPALSDFAPYVAAVHGAAVVFQATRRNGGSGLYRADRAGVVPLAQTSPSFPFELVSHPAVAADGQTSIYAHSAHGGTALIQLSAPAADWSAPRSYQVLARSGQGLASIGPLGPTTNRTGAVAFRGHLPDGRAAIFLARHDQVQVLATATEPACFDGLPCVNDAGVVAFRATGADHAARIAVWEDGLIHTVVRTGDRFVSLGRFPSLAPDGSIVFVAADQAGEAGVYRAHAGTIERLLGPTDGFEDFRTPLDCAGGLLFYATPAHGTLGLYGGVDPVEDRLLGLGDEFAGSTITDLAVNPASVDTAGRFAARLALADGRQAIVHGDPED